MKIETLVKNWMNIMILMLAMEGIAGNKAKTELDFTVVEKGTYRYYQMGSWDSLIDLGKMALKQKIDYYYLRYRMGVAYFSKENYIKSIEHFEKAYAFNTLEKSLLEYLYLGNLYLNRGQAARYYAALLPDTDRETLTGNKKQFVDELYIETGFSTNDDYNLHGDLEEQWTDSTVYLDDLFWGDLAYGHAGIRVNLSKRISMYLGYSYLHVDRRQEYLFNTDLILDSIVHTLNTIDYYYEYERKYHSFNSQVSQNELYANLGVDLGKGWSLHPAFHYQLVRFQNESVEYHPEPRQAIAYHDKLTGKDVFFTYEQNNYRFEGQAINLNDYVLGLNISKRLSYFTLAMEGAISKFDDLSLRQFSLQVSYFPWGNLNFYGASAVKYVYEANHPVADERKQLIFHQKIGLKVFSKLWIEGSLLYGELQNTSWNRSFVVYNVPDGTDYLGEACLLIPLFPKFELNIRYQYMMRKGKYLAYTHEKDTRNTASKFIQQSYTNQTIIGGIKWKL